MQTYLYVKPCKICQSLKKRKTLYGHLVLKIIAELKTWDLVHVDLIVPYSESIKQQQPWGIIIKNNVILTCMTMISVTTGWFKIIELPTYDLDEVMVSKDEYIYKSSTRVSQLFNNIWISRHPRPWKFMFDNGYEFKQDFTPLLKDFDIGPALMTLKTHQITLWWSRPIN